MYIYLIKYNGEVIASAEDNDCATAAIMQYMSDGNPKDINLFELESIKHFTKEEFEDGTED